MEYYRVKREYDNFGRADGDILVKNELYTRREVERYKIPAERIERENVKRCDVYWMFGARFSVNHHYSS